MIRPGRWLLTIAAVGALTAQTARSQEPGAGQKVGEKVDDAAAAARRGVDRAGDAVRAEFHKLKASINAMDVQGRVYSRLRWDKALDGTRLDVEVTRDGTVTLTGIVPDAAAKAKAVRLATETIGVVRVIDGLATPVAPVSP